MKTNMLLEASLMNWRQHLVFPSAMLAAAMSIGTTGIATANQCLVSTIAFTSTHGAGAAAFPNAEIYLADWDGTETKLTNVRRLTENTEGDGLPTLSPDGKKIVFDSNRARGGEILNTSDLFLMKDDGSDQTLLTRGSTASWSPDGKYIAFHASASGDPCFRSTFSPSLPGCPIKPDPGAATWDSDIFIAKVGDLLENVDARINITNSPDHIEDDPDWSPDGQKIVFARHDVGDLNQNIPTSTEIYLLNLETGVEERLTFNLEEERSPAWSSDGTQIVYSCRKSGLLQICVINADGTGLVQLTNNPVNHLGPHWSPDGEKIVFHRVLAMVPGQQQQIWVMNADGTGQTQLTPISGTDSTNFLLSWGVVRANCKEDDKDS